MKNQATTMMTALLVGGWAGAAAAQAPVFVEDGVMTVCTTAGFPPLT